jgi:energy-coupling factor transporter transmembrane protein EcfT
MLGVFSLLAITLTNPVWQGSLLALVVILLLVAGYKEFHKLLLALAPFIIVMNLAFLYFMSAYRANVWEAVLLIDLRILLIFFSFAFFAFTTDLVAVVKLLKRMGLPEAVYLPFYVVLRFLPELERDHQEIRQLQKLKGITILL